MARGRLRDQSLPALESIQNHGQRYHEPAVEAVVAMVVHELE